MASFIDQGKNFEGSQIVLIDLDVERLRLVATLAEKMAAYKGVDIEVAFTTDRRRGLVDCDAVLTSFRPGGFEARHIDESVPLKHGIIGQETQGLGGFFMALRSVAVMKDIVSDVKELCPRAWLFNYTNPVNIVSEAVTHHANVPIVSLCEGPILFPQMLAEAADLDPDSVDVVLVGLNHASWSIRHSYRSGDLMTLVSDAYERKKDDPASDPHSLRMLQLAATMGSVPAEYFQYYYFEDEVLAELRAKATTRSQDIMASVEDYWRPYEEQARTDSPVLDPSRSRGGIHELELAVDVMDAMFNNRGEVWPVNVPNRGAISGLPDDLVVEVPGFVDANGVAPIAQGPLPRHLSGLVMMLGEYQALAAEAAWCGSRADAIRALASNPLVRSPGKAEAVFDEMASALQDHLPDRLLG
jgi:6-phospho-beta-glucosidase